MPRPKRERSVRCQPGATCFIPQGVPLDPLEEVVLTLDELEALRLADLQGRSQAAAAALMGVSRATFGRIVASARATVAGALIQGKALRIAGGPVTHSPPQEVRMKVAIAANPHGLVSRHFGKSAEFRVFTLDNGLTVAEERRDNPHLHDEHGHGHGQGQGRPLHLEGEHLHGHGCGHGCGHGHGHGHGHGGDGPSDDAATDAPTALGLGAGGVPQHRGHGGWIAATLGDCEAVITAGIGAGAVSNLRAAGVRTVVLDAPLPIAEALERFARGQL